MSSPGTSKQGTLYLQVLAAIALGVLLGVLAPDTAKAMKPLGDAFVKLVKMVIGPVILCTVTLGIAGMRELRQVGRVGVKALLYFEVVSTLALVLGLLVVNLAQPGRGFHVDVATLDTSGLAAFQGRAPASTVEFLLAIIPTTPVDALSKGELLAILFFAVLLGLACAKTGEAAKPLVTVLESFRDVTFTMVAMLMRLAPIGAFGAMAFTVGAFGAGSLLRLAHLMAAFYATCLLFLALVLAPIVRLVGGRLLPLLRALKEELLLVLGTSSSESALPGLVRKLEGLGCDKAVVGLVVPTGYSFNLDGTNIYMTMAALFVAQATDTELSLGEQLAILGVAMISSKGAAGVTGSGFITLGATLAVVPEIPVAGMALLLGVDRFMSEARALTNFVGNAVATLAVARWEGALDRDALARGLGTAPSTDPRDAA